MSNSFVKKVFLGVSNVNFAEKIILGLYDADLVKKSGIPLPSPSQDIDADMLEENPDGMLDIPNAAYGVYLAESAAIRVIAQDIRSKEQKSPSPAP